MALFNAPQDQPDHAWRAVQAAISMQRKIRELTATWEHKLIFSIGLNSGEAVVGNIGSDSLRNYTAIGDTVNLAKRIQESAAPGQVLISKHIYDLALATAPWEVLNDKDSLVVHLLGTTSVKGRSKPAVIYEVNPYADPSDPAYAHSWPADQQKGQTRNLNDPQKGKTRNLNDPPKGKTRNLNDPPKGKTRNLNDPPKGKTRSLAGLNPFRF